MFLFVVSMVFYDDEPHCSGCNCDEEIDTRLPIAIFSDKTNANALYDFFIEIDVNAIVDDVSQFKGEISQEIPIDEERFIPKEIKDGIKDIVFCFDTVEAFKQPVWHIRNENSVFYSAVPKQLFKDVALKLKYNKYSYPQETCKSCASKHSEMIKIKKWQVYKNSDFYRLDMHKTFFRD